MGSSPIDWLRRLRGAPRLSRNRNFELFEEEAARQGLRRHLRLRALARELCRCASLGTVRLLTAPASEGDAARSGAAPRARLVVEVEVPSLRFRRQVFVDELELELLSEDPAVAALLGLDPP